MRIFLHLRKGVNGRQFVTSLGKQIRAGEHRTWEAVKARPLTIRHKGRFKASGSVDVANPLLLSTIIRFQP